MSTELSANDLFEQAAASIYQEEVAKKTGNVRHMLMKEKQLIEDREKAEKELAKIEKNLMETQARIAKFKAGDWSILSTFSQQPKKEEQTI